MSHPQSSFMNHKTLLMVCGILGALAVSLGAFGAHGLKNVLSAQHLQTYTTGITYHFYHTLALLGIAVLVRRNSSVWLRSASICFILGIFLFSGSLYLLATREVIGLTNYRWLGPITPIGGVFFILGWLAVSIGAVRNSESKAAI